MKETKYKAELYGYDLSTQNFLGQQKHDSPPLTEEEIIIYESFLKSFNKNKENPVAICEFYINEVLCLKIDNQVKSDFVDRITFLKDLVIFIENKAKKEMVAGQRCNAHSAGNFRYSQFYIIDILVVLIMLVMIFRYSSVSGFISLLSMPLFFLLIYRWNNPIITSQHGLMAGYAFNESNFINTLKGITEIKA